MTTGEPVEREYIMKTFDWKSKLTSRKFWAAVASFVTMLIVTFGGAQTVATQVTAIIMAGATVIAYILGEGLVDAASAGNSSTTTDDSSSDPVIGTVTDTSAKSTISTGTAEAGQARQVTSGLGQ